MSPYLKHVNQLLNFKEKNQYLTTAQFQNELKCSFIFYESIFGRTFLNSLAYSSDFNTEYKNEKLSDTRIVTDVVSVPDPTFCLKLLHAMNAHIRQNVWLESCTLSSNIVAALAQKHTTLSITSFADVISIFQSISQRIRSKVELFGAFPAFKTDIFDPIQVNTKPAFLHELCIQFKNYRGYPVHFARLMIEILELYQVPAVIKTQRPSSAQKNSTLNTSLNNDDDDEKKSSEAVNLECNVSQPKNKVVKNVSFEKVQMDGFKGLKVSPRTSLSGGLMGSPKSSSGGSPKGGKAKGAKKPQSTIK